MNETIQTILNRRSIRRFTSEQIRDQDLKTILECGLYAPNGKNLQYPRFLVIQDPERLEQLNQVIRDELAGMEVIEGQFLNSGILRARKEGYHFIYHAPTLISAVAPRNHGNSMADCACALENMQLAATALGLGACWSNQAHWLTGAVSVREQFRDLGLREDEDFFGSVAIGCIDYTPQKAGPRKAGRIVLDRDRVL